MCPNAMVLGVKMAEIFEKKHAKNTKKCILKNTKKAHRIRIFFLKIGLRSDLSWPKLGLEPKCHEPGTFSGFGKREHTNTQTRFLFYKYR